MITYTIQFKNDFGVWAEWAKTNTISRVVIHHRAARKEGWQETRVVSSDGWTTPADAVEYDFDTARLNNLATA